MKRICTIILILRVIENSFSQGSIDIDTNIQMGVASKEHVTITNSAFSVHDGAGQTPLIYGDFGSGKVGFGTSSPSERLHIVAGAFRTDLGVIGNSMVLTGSGSNLQVKHDGSSQVAIFNSGGGVHFRGTLGTTTLLSIKPTGDVGIGTNNPTRKLQVEGTTFLNGLTTISNNLTVTSQVNIEKNHPNNIVGSKVELRFSGNYYSGAIALENTASNPGYLNPKLAFRLQNFQTYQAWDVIERMTILSNGRVGINRTNPNYTLDVNGSIRYSSGGLNGSDRRWKKEITKIYDATSALNQVNPVSYIWRTEEFPDNNFDSRRHYGVIAQELEEVLPELVDTDNEGYKSVDYTSMIALLIKAMQEKDEEINELRTLNSELRSEVRMTNEELRSEKVDQVEFERLENQLTALIRSIEKTRRHSEQSEESRQQK